jgi:hypothetical protein
MTTFLTLWFLAVSGGLVVKGVSVLRRRRAAAAALALHEATERSARPARERAEREAREQKTREEGEQRRRDDAKAACELLYAHHAPDIAARLPKATLDRFLERLLRTDLPADVVERKAAEIQQLICSHLDQSRGGKKAETVETVQAWYAEQLSQLAGVMDVRLRESFEAMLLQQFHERMLRVMGDEA